MAKPIGGTTSRIVQDIVRGRLRPNDVAAAPPKRPSGPSANAAQPLEIPGQTGDTFQRVNNRPGKVPHPGS